MQFTFKIIILFLLISLNTSAQVPSETIPNFKFYRFDNTTFTNKNLSKSKLQFFLFFDSDCEHCRKVISYINEHYKTFKKASMYLITQDSKEKAAYFIKTYGAKLKDKKDVIFLLDSDLQFIIKFKPRKYPSIFLYSKEKKLMIYEDDDQNIYKFESAISKN